MLTFTRYVSDGAEEQSEGMKGGVGKEDRYIQFNDDNSPTFTTSRSERQ